MFVRYSCVLLMLLLGCTPQSGEQQSRNTGDALGGTTAQKERVEEEIGEPEPDVLLPVAPLPVVEVVSDPWVPTVPFFGGGGGGGNSKLNCSNGLAEGDACSDGDICTYSDRCVAGKCVGNDIPECCTEKTVATACDDNDPCTDQVCNEFNECEYPPAQGPIPCDDNNLCTTNDTCSNGACAGTPNVVCFPNACNTSACNPATGMCDLTPKTDGTDCSPLFPSSCVESYECDCGECVATKIPDGTDCSDSCELREVCADGVCVPAVPQADGSVCAPACGMNEVCVESACYSNVPQPYCPDTDSSLCTTPLCVEIEGQLSCGQIEFGGCFSGDPCLTSSGCDPATGNCAAFQPVNCDDKNPCTMDTCDGGIGGAGCQHTPIGGDLCQGCETNENCFPNPNLSTCTTWTATCTAGLCSYSEGPNNTCPAQTCKTSDCTYTECVYEDLVCSDSNPNDCKDFRCDLNDGQCKPVTDTNVCGFPANICCNNIVTGGGDCNLNCPQPNYCFCFFGEVPQP